MPNPTELDMHALPPKARSTARQVAGMVAFFTLSAGLAVLLTLAAVFPR